MAVEPTTQFYLSRLQVINWGVFDGYHSIPFSPSGTLITGSSGSGKSSLLDAISLAFLPSHRRNFNASGDTTAAGAGTGKRTVDKYVRGAWGERREGTSRQIMYLRGTGPAWSAVAVTYTDGAGHAVTGLVLKWLAAEKTSDPGSRYHLIDADRDIFDLCNRWAANGYDASVFRDDGWQGGRSESQYLAQLYSSIGIRASEAAQQLLGKAKSLKSVGGLEQFVREFMLDEPASLTGVEEALEQINPLVEARGMLDVARRKRNTLGNIDAVQVRYAEEAAKFGVVDTVDNTMIRDYVDQMRLQQAGPEIANLDDQITQLGAQRDDFGARQRQLKNEHNSLMAQINAVAVDLVPLQQRLSEAEQISEEVARRRSAYEDKVVALDYSPPERAEDFWSMRETLMEEADRLHRELTTGNQAYVEASAKEVRAREARDSVRSELERVQRLGSPLPRTEYEMRARIAKALGVPERDLVYVAELMELKPEESRWRNAVEKVLRGAGLRLLIPDAHQEAALRFVNENDMRGRIQLQHVQHGAQLREPAPGTLATKVHVADPTHDSAVEALNVIAGIGDYVCVDGPEEFARQSRAVTDQGLRKDSGRLSVKDDRSKLRPSDYIFLGDAATKIEALQGDLDSAEATYGTARSAREKLDERRAQLQARERACRALCDQFMQWSDIDTDSVDEQLSRLQSEHDLLVTENPDAERLQQRADECWQRVEKAIQQIGSLNERESNLDRRRTALLELTERLNPGEVPQHARDTLDGYAADIALTMELLDADPYRAELTRVIGRERDRLRGDRNRSHDELAGIMAAYDSSFPDAIPNDSDDFDERVHDYVALCRRIDERELPDAYERMQRLITEQAPGAILNLHMIADNEARRITEQIARVNTGLGAVEFNRGTRLTLHAGTRHLTAVDELNEKAQRISARVSLVSFGDETAMFEQYTDILQLRKLLAGNTPEDRQWTRDALDVRNRFVLYCEERDAETGEVIRTYSNSGDNSGGEQEKLMAFCLAGALSFNLANPGSNDTKPVFAQLMLDEAFSKSDPQFAQQALSAFRKFGFQLVIVATVQNTTTIQPYIDSVVMVSKPDAAVANARPVASVTAASISEFTELRRNSDPDVVRAAPA
ncbi:AAA family ATPase [Mycobacterium sp. 21AC1]|uniref:ATP-binding protein n=1 Tax=[Mycobacterium] appelbergii TaxID=2939269 RepID=UPI002938D8B2|nr:ATP-binding protein [Mycobacterium sp. 21AC1]MDV3128629.1 AAA family ATPase [Mycobacterium sp. 21AC1]